MASKTTEVVEQGEFSSSVPQKDPGVVEETE
jgi:hypothetical protein